MKRLDLEEFYQDSNQYYQGFNNNIPEGLGGVILITDKQSIGVYNVSKKDINGNDIIGLGSHGSTVESILASIFNVQLEGKSNKRMRMLNQTIPGCEFNYVYVRLVNEINNKFVTVQIPGLVNEYQYSKLTFLNDIFKILNVKTYAEITKYNPNKMDYDDTFVDVKLDSLDDALMYLKNNNKIGVLKGNDKEIIYKYDEEFDLGISR